MLMLEIAGGIVLAAVVLRFWRQSLPAVAVLGVALVLGVLYAFIGTNGRYDIGWGPVPFVIAFIAASILLLVRRPLPPR